MSKLPANDIDTAQMKDTVSRLMQHYDVHHGIVLKKLGHAQDATDISVKEDNSSPQMPSNAWAEIIEMFEKCGITQEELFEIDGILDMLPPKIAMHFERLIKLDQALQTMMKTMESLNYEDAIKISDAVQSKANPMSGLMADEYEITETSSPQDRVQAFKIVR